MEWFYAKGGQQIGPVDTATLQHLLASGQVSANDNVWRDGMAGWLPAGSIPELYAPPMGAPGAYGQMPAPGYPPQQGMSYYGTPASTGKSYKGMAIGSLVCSCIGMLCFGIILGVVGFILGLVALNGMKRTGNNEGRGMAIAGVIVGIIAAVLAVLILIFMISTHSGPFANL